MTRDKLALSLGLRKYECTLCAFVLVEVCVKPE